MDVVLVYSMIDSLR